LRQCRPSLPLAEPGTLSLGPVGALAKQGGPEHGLRRKYRTRPMGEEYLRHQIARRYLTAGMVVPIDEIIITSGALDALKLSLQTLTSPGDIVAIECPTFYAALSAIERLHLKAVEIPVDSHEGLDLHTLADALERYPIRACWFMTSNQHPTGVTLSDDKKQALVELLAHHEVPLIEDDVYSELHFGPAPTRPAKRFDRKDLVLHCGSFSQSLAPRYRIGWVAAARSHHASRVKMDNHAFGVLAGANSRSPTISNTAAMTVSCASCEWISGVFSPDAASHTRLFPAGHVARETGRRLFFVG
jgi:DNA-binding transcriptional MocR family regulator